MPTQTRAIGLATFHNKLSLKEGSLLTADNVVIDSDNIVRPRRGLADYGTATTGNVDVKQIITYKDSLLRHFGSTLQFDSDNNGTFLSFAGSFAELETGIRIKYIEASSNLYFTTTDGIKKISGTITNGTTNFTTAAGFIENAGGAKALDLTGTLEYSSGAFFTAKGKVAYRIVWGKKDANTNEIIGAPSSRLVLTNSDETIEATTVLTFSVPSDVTTTDYFYQVFRTGIVTTALVADLPDLEPGDEMNRVIENNITAAEIAASEVVVTDSTPDSFRVSGLLLYTNPTSGDGILQANDKPPVAKDVGLFRDSTFYANTSSIQRKQFSMLSVSALVSGTSKFIVGNDSDDREYTFVGATEVTDVTFDTKANTTDGGYFLLNSASDERKFFAWADKTGSTTEPSDTDTVGRRAIKADISGDTTANDVAITFAAAINAIADFASPAPGGATITITNDKNGNTTDAVDGLTGVGGGAFAIVVTTQGDGEEANTDPGGDVLLSSLVSIGQSIDETARSLVNIINRDSATKEKTTFVTVAKASLTDGESFLFSSGKDVNKFQFYYDVSGTISAPTSPQAGFTAVEIDVSGDTTADDVATTTASVIGGVSGGLDFDTTAVTSTVTVTNVTSGQTTDASDVDTGYSFTIVTQGSNEGIVNAFYLSGEDDLPGIILLEARNLSDPEFFIGVQDDGVDITGQFSPKLDNAVSISSMALGTGSVGTTVTTGTAHGLVVGDEAYIYNTSTAIFGKKTVTVVGSTTTFDIADTFVATSTGRVFNAKQNSDNDVSPNRIFFSKNGIPEAVPLVNFIDVGGKDSAIERIIALRDNLFVLKEEGVYILTGDVAPNFTVRLLDNSINILSPDSAAVLNNKIYMLSTQGIATVSDTGIGIISRPIEDKILEATNSLFSFRTIAFGVGYESDRAYIIWLPTLAADTTATQAFRFNTFNQSWVRWTLNANSGIVNPVDDKLYISVTDKLRQERKIDDRTDHADQDFAIQVTTQIIDTTKTDLILSTSSNVAVGDVILQTQDVTIAKYNRLLRKLDVDTGMENDYESLLVMVAGEDMSASIAALVTKVDADDITAQVYTTPTGGSFAQDKTDFNALVSELNTSTQPVFNSYQSISDTTTFESIITAIDDTTNTATLSYLMPFISGVLTLFKGISTEIGYAPHHFGDPSMTKQISEGTIDFDGNDFFSATISYATDLSRDFTDQLFLGRGVGFWGSFDWEDNSWGGEGTEVPLRTLIPREKQRCRYIFIKFKHVNARESFNVIGISLKPRKMSERGYRDI